MKIVKSLSLAVIVLCIIAFCSGRSLADDIYCRPPDEEFFVSQDTDIEETEIDRDELLKDYNLNYEEMPYYFQGDYPDVLYGRGTIKSSGCSVTCLAMVASYLTDTEYLPDYFALKYAQPGMQYGSYIDVIEQGAKDLGLNYQGRIYQFSDILEELCNGKIVIALMNENSLFTNVGHFIVLYGINDEGRILVRDPNIYNYSNPKLKYGFENGFELDDIKQGNSGGLLFGTRNIDIIFEERPNL